MIKRISDLGLGTMGSGMAANLLKAGYELTVWNRSAEKREPFARKGARVANSPCDAVRDVDLVLYSLRQRSNPNDDLIENLEVEVKAPEKPKVNPVAAKPAPSATPVLAAK